ncbi:TonB-dependent receptor domain-containing protein [Fischerella thermalis]|uniref:TonB-dependent receptor n=1 Tax=Fischerella thermalis CCMEE 5318 TaxID=2019666 RepID=A0A2N6L4E0_9CYAN|nr:TonB-dependent receptor [Fischerella thermalis]PMB15553.1 TonB-dependent receptor [Fischerella thermalis CCMEE 5318]
MKGTLATIHLLPISWITGVAVPILILIAAPVKAQDTQVSVEPTKNIPQLRESQRPFTQAQMLLQSLTLSQAGSAEIVQVTGVKVNSTAKGVEVILETPLGEQLQVVNRSEGNNYIVDIPNAQLRLTSGDKFRQEKPVAGITEITVTNQDANTIRVTVTGESAIPQFELFDSDEGLILSFISPASSTQQPPPPPPTTPQQQQPQPQPTPPATETEPDETPQSSEQQEPIELIVTAEKTPENLQDVPISITVLDEDQIESGDINSFEEVAKNTPNFSFFSSGENRLSTFYSVRGITNFNLFSRDAVSFYVDDVPYDFSGFLNIDLNDLERVEVLRGPQNTLYGRSSLGGVVNVITKRPTNEFEFSNSISYGNYDDFRTQASISGPLIEDRLFFRLSGNYGTRDGYTYNTFLDRDVDGGSGGNGRIQLLWTPSKDWDISFNASFDDYREGAPAYVLLNQEDPFETELDFNGFNDLVSNAQSVRIAYNNPDFRFTSITANRFSSQKAAYDLDYTTADGQISAPDFESRLFSQEFRFQSPETADKFQWILGGYFESSRFENNRPFIYGADSLALGFAFPPGEDKVDVTSETNTYAIFSQVSYKPIESLTLTAGLRYESTNSNIDASETFTSADGSLVLPLLSLEDAEKNGDALLPRFAIEYKFNPNVMAYGSVARGYRPAGVSFQPISEDTATFDAETSWNYEVGLKSAWLDNRLIVNVALFHNSVNNFQFPSLRGDRLIVDNADVSITGAELEVRATPVNGLDIIAGLGLVDSKFKNGNDAFTGESLKGNRISFSPDLTYNLAVQYRSVGGLFGRVELTGFGTTYFDDINTLKQDPYALVNVRLGYELENYGIYLFANNIFNTEYLTQAFDSTTGAAGTYGAPVTYGVQFRSRF